MSTLLALDASSSACSCAVWRDGSVFSRYALTPREHTRRLMPMIDDVLAEAGLTPADLDALAYGHGPGSFTGLRIAAGVFKGYELAESSHVVLLNDILLGVGLSFIAALICIKLFLAALDRIGMWPFAAYRLVLGVVLFLLWLG